MACIISLFMILLQVNFIKSMLIIHHLIHKLLCYSFMCQSINIHIFLILNPTAHWY